MLEWRMNKQGGGERVTKAERWESWQGRGWKCSVRTLKELVFACLFRFSLLGFCPPVIVLCVLLLFFF